MEICRVRDTSGLRSFELVGDLSSLRPVVSETCRIGDLSSWRYFVDLVTATVQ